MEDITTQEEQDYLAGVLSDENSENVWIGLTSSEENRPLYWSDDSALSFTAWNVYGRGRNQSCIRMTRDSNYKWGDTPCERSNGYVCEFEGIL